MSGLLAMVRVALLGVLWCTAGSAHPLHAQEIQRDRQIQDSTSPGVEVEVAVDASPESHESHDSHDSRDNCDSRDRDPLNAFIPPDAANPAILTPQPLDQEGHASPVNEPAEPSEQQSPAEGGHGGHSGHGGHGDKSPGPGQESSDGESGLGSIASSADDFDDFQDVAFHPRVYVEGRIWDAPSRRVPTEYARALVRLEDRRCEKPPRV